MKKSNTLAINVIIKLRRWKVGRLIFSLYMKKSNILVIYRTINLVRKEV